jgi:hypothetical protein
MKTTLEIMTEKAERLKKDILRKYSDNKKLAKQLIKGAEQTADYRLLESDPIEKWHIYYVDELEKRI